MISVGRFAALAKVTTRTVRFYESIGLLPSSSRGENNYRHYNVKLLDRMNRIRDLQELGFSLDEIKQIINFSESDIGNRLKKLLQNIEQEIDELEQRRSRITEILSVSNKIDTGESLTPAERNLFLESIKEKVIKGLKSRHNVVDDATLSYLARDGFLKDRSEFGAFIEGVKKCVEFAKEKNLKLGTARGSAPASLSLYGLGYSGINPMKYEMIPERLSTQTPFFHIDVEFERGQEFVDFCRHVNHSLSYGEIQAFKMPLIDIVQSVHKTLGKEIDYESIDDNSDIVLDPFRTADVQNIFQFDFSEDALVMNFERFLPEYLGLDKMSKYLEGQTIYNFRDIINLTALWRPHCKEIVDRIELYKRAKQDGFSYGFISESLEAWLKPNFGTIVYHEDLIKIISEYTGWDFARCNSLRRTLMKKNADATREQNEHWAEFKNLVSPEVANFVAEESKWSFCLPHAISFAKFTKQTAVLKSLHKDIYFTEIKRFEQKHGVTWDDIGIRMKGVSIHQG